MQNMKNLKIKRAIFFTCLLSLFIISSCKKFIQVGEPKGTLDRKAAFLDDKSAVSAISGVYSLMSNASVINSVIDIRTGLAADELITTNTNDELLQFSNNSLLNDNASVLRIWSDLYKLIYNINSVIEGVSGSKTISLATKSQVLGEAYFLRGFCYYYLVNLYNKIPYVTSTDFEVNSLLAPKDRVETINLIIEDLIKSKNLLTNNYITGEKARPNKMAASALLARIYLNKKDWVKSEAEATEIITSGLYTDLPPIGDVFLKQSKETIWQIIPVTANLTPASLLINATTNTIPLYGLADNLLNSFEIGDRRFTNWVGKNTVGNIPYYYPAKYKQRTSSTSLNEYFVVFRAGEQFLIRAEARARQNKLTGPNSALEDLNLIRARAGLSSANANNLIGVISAIEKERQVELFVEVSLRWFYITNTDGFINSENTRADEILRAVKGNNWNLTDRYFPIPLSQLNANPYLVQNPGY